MLEMSCDFGLDRVEWDWEEEGAEGRVGVWDGEDWWLGREDEEGGLLGEVMSEHVRAASAFFSSMCFQ